MCCFDQCFSLTWRPTKSWKKKHGSHETAVRDGLGHFEIETNNCFVTSYKKHTKNNIVKSRLHEIKYQMIYEIDLPLQVPAAASREDISSNDLSNPQPLVKKTCHVEASRNADASHNMLQICWYAKWWSDIISESILCNHCLDPRSLWNHLQLSVPLSTKEFEGHLFIKLLPPLWHIDLPTCIPHKIDWSASIRSIP